jgi:hypothetical protein
MALRPAFPSPASVAATLLALALAALMIAPVDVAKPTAPDNPDSDGYQHGDDAYPLHPHRH